MQKKCLCAGQNRFFKEKVIYRKHHQYTGVNKRIKIEQIADNK